MNAHTKPPAEPQGAPLYLPTDVTPEKLFQAIGRLRKEARDEIDRLIRFLDDTDNHMELEPDDEGDDAELEDHDPAEDDGLREPSLGSLGDHHPNQERWAVGKPRPRDRRRRIGRSRSGRIGRTGAVPRLDGRGDGVIARVGILPTLRRAVPSVVALVRPPIYPPNK